MRAHPKKAKAGSRPILSHGKYGVRGQVDLIDYQSSEYAGYRFLLTYVDHGLKLGFTFPLPSKQVHLSSCKLTTGGSSSTLLHAVALTMVLLMLKAKLQVVTATKELWPGCTMVTGRPRHSPSNGGSERFNRTIEEKVPCVAVFGQVPRVGLQSLRLNDDLANSLTTEADLNAAMGLPQDKAIDDDSPAASEPVAEDVAAPPTDGLAADLASPAASEPMAEDAAAPPTDGLAAEFASPAASEPMAEDAAAPPTDGLAAEFASPAASEPMAEDAAAPPTDGLAAEFASPAASEPMAEDAAAPPTDGLAAEFASPAASEPMAEDAAAPPTDGLAAEFASPAASEPMAEDATAPPTDGLAAEFASPAASEPMYGIGCSSPAH
eukprot:jgi/Tetstr1/431846/TSEL_021337.t2